MEIFLVGDASRGKKVMCVLRPNYGHYMDTNTWSLV